jgi:hypothetical protein
VHYIISLNDYGTKTYGTNHVKVQNRSGSIIRI